MAKQVNRLITGAFILTIAGIISKVLSAMYRIPLQNLTGDLGFYTYQQIYPIIATVIILSLYGFPLAVSRLTAQQIANGIILNYRNYFGPVFIILFLMNSIVTIIIFIFAPFLANFMHDEHLKLPLQMSAFLFLLIPFLSLFRGVFQAQLQMKQTAYSQIIEQFIRVTLIIISSWLIFRGTVHVRSIAEASIISSFAGMMVAISILFIFFIRSYPLKQQKVNHVEKINWRSMIWTLITFGLIASLNHLTLILMQFVDVLTLVPQLVKTGLTPIEAMKQKGIFDRGIPLIQFGVVLGSSFALVFIPSINVRNKSQQLEAVQDAFSISIYIATGATIGLIIIYPEVNRLLFTDDLGTSVLQILAISIFLLSLSITGTAVLQAYHHIKFTVISLLSAILLKWLLNYMLIEKWGLAGSAIATVSSLFLLSLFVIVGIYKKARFSPFSKIKWFPFLGSSSVMGLYLLMMNYFIKTSHFSRLALLIYVLLLVISGAIIYLMILLRYNVIDERQIAALPYSNQLLSLQKRVRKPY